MDCTETTTARERCGLHGMVDVQGQGQRLTSVDAGDKPCVTGRGQAQESRALRKEEDMQLQAGLHPQACQIPPHRVPGDRGRVCRAGAFPDHSRHSRQHGGKIFRRAVKSVPSLLNIWR